LGASSITLLCEVAGTAFPIHQDKLSLLGVIPVGQ
jgi:hypothetical protein